MRHSLEILLSAAIMTSCEASGAAAPVPSCAARFAVQKSRQDPVSFSFTAKDKNASGVPSIESAMGDIRCSPSGRVIVASGGDTGHDDDDTLGSQSIVLIDPVSREASDLWLVSDYSLSPDNRLLVYGPWGGPTGQLSVLGAQTFDLLDLDSARIPPGGPDNATAEIYPAASAAFHTLYRSGTKDSAKYNEAFNTWYRRFETMAHPVSQIRWQGIRKFSFLIANDLAPNGAFAQPRHFQTVTVIVQLPAGKPPSVTETVSDGPDCTANFAKNVAFFDAVNACLSGQ